MSAEQDVKTTDEVFGVRIQRKDGTCFLSCSGGAAPKLFWNRKDATAHKRDLWREGFKTARVVPVTMAYTFPVPA